MKNAIKNIAKIALETAKKASNCALAVVFAVNTVSAAVPANIGDVPSLESLISQTGITDLTSPIKIKLRRMVPITAYSSTPDQTDDTPFITASGAHVADGIIAANFLPFNTKVQIPALFGEKVFVVKDRMHSRFSDRVDIWFADRAMALKFGIHKTEIVIL